MTSSTFDPDNIPESDRQLGKGHGRTTLGPGDLSNTDSDVRGGCRAIEAFDIGHDRSTPENADSSAIAAGDDTKDLAGTGENSAAGSQRNAGLAGGIRFDRIDTSEPGQDRLNADGSRGRSGPTWRDPQ